MARKTQDFTLIETLRWEPQSGFQRMDQHMRRLTRSADALGFRQPVDAIARLEEQVQGADPLKVRLVMDYRGRSQVTVMPAGDIPGDAVWTLRVAKTRLDSGDTLYRHKTSKRDPYEAARAEFSAEDADEVVMLNENGEICECTSSSIFVEDADGSLLTPPLDCGILPGVLRADLIRARRARSHRMTLNDIAGRRMYVGNSWRGLVCAQLAAT